MGVRKGTTAFLAYDREMDQAEDALHCDVYEEFIRQAGVSTEGVAFRDQTEGMDRRPA